MVQMWKNKNSLFLLAFDRLAFGPWTSGADPLAAPRQTDVYFWFLQGPAHQLDTRLNLSPSEEVWGGRAEEKTGNGFQICLVSIKQSYQNLHERFELINAN